MTLKNFDAYQLAKEFFLQCSRLKLSPYLRDQLARASASIALNLAEGSAKPTPADKRKFYFTALGSLRECQAILDLTGSPEGHLQLADRLGACLYRLCHAQ